MAGYSHPDFATPGSEAKHRDLSYFIEAWLDRWLLDDPTADDRLLAGSVLDRPTASLLSTHFLSGAYLPGLVDTSDYAALVADTTAPRPSARTAQARQVGRDRARRGIRFAFSANDPAATFECRLDQGKWRECESPERVKTGVGRHEFRVRASDQRGQRRGQARRVEVPREPRRSSRGR